MASSSPVNAVNIKLNLARIRLYVNRLPFFTRIIFLLVFVSCLLSLFLPSIPAWGALLPGEVDLFHAFRLNTFPIVHTGFLHALLSLIALVPLLERFESEHGTLVSLALFVGPFATLPGFIYIFIDHIILRRNTSVQGASVWIYLLISCEAIKLHRANPHFRLFDHRLPVWPYPLLLLLTLHFLLPTPLYRSDSLLANVAGSAIGYGFELSYLKFLIPPERILRFVEGKLNLLGRLPHYVSVDQKTFGRYGAVLPMSSVRGATSPVRLATLEGGALGRVRSPVRGFVAAAGGSRDQ